MNGYELSRKWFDWCFENPELISPNHSALYFFAVEHCNRMGWKKKFGFPTTMAKDAIGIKSYNTYIKTLNDLVDWGFIEMIERSKNQYSSNIIALSYFDKALDNALDKATIKHVTKQSESTIQSICSIDKPLTNKPITKKLFIPPSLQNVIDYFIEKGYTESSARKAFDYYEAGSWIDSKGNKVKNWKQKMQGVWFKPDNEIPVQKLVSNGTNQLQPKYND